VRGGLSRFEHLAQLADRALRIVDGVDLGERDAVAGAVGLDVEDAAVRLDRGGAIARGEQDASEAALQGDGGARTALRHRGVRGVDQQRLGLALIAGVGGAAGEHQGGRRVTRVVLDGAAVLRRGGALVAGGVEDAAPFVVVVAGERGAISGWPGTVASSITRSIAPRASGVAAGQVVLLGEDVVAVLVGRNRSR